MLWLSLLVLAPQWIPAAVVVLAQSAPETLPLDSIIQWGPPGVVILLLFTGHFALGREVKQARDDREEMKKDRDYHRNLNDQIIRSLEVVPEVQKATIDSLKVIEDLLKGIQAESRRTRGTHDDSK